MMKYSDPSEDETVSDRAKFVTPSGTQTADKFVLDSSFIEEISQYLRLKQLLRKMKRKRFSL